MIATVTERLRDAAGATAVLPEGQVDRLAVAGVVPRAVVKPETAEAVAATLAVCSEEGWPVEPAGAATWLRAGTPPAEPPVIISTAALNRIREYEPADLVAGAEAGVPLAVLQQELARNRQTLVLDPPGAPASTLGAIAACASAGPLRAGHGTPRDMVIGAEVVTGDGRILHFGGRVVKNVAGYDIVRLLIGSRGSFGIITSLFLRLRGTPETDTTFRWPLATPSEAVAAATEVRRRMEPDALELIGPGEASGGWTVLARFRGSAAARDEAAGRMRLLAGNGCQALGPEAAAATWDELASSETNATVYIRFADLPNRLSETLAAAATLVRPNSRSDNETAGWRLAAHGAEGIVRLWREDAVPAATLRTLPEALPALASDFASRRGTVIWPVWPGPAPASPESDPVISRITRELKARFDPAGILSVGRHFTEI